MPLDRSNRLYIFASSDRPDPYVNVLVHALSTYPLVEVRFIGIREHEYSNEQVDGRVNATLTAVYARLEELASGLSGEDYSPSVDMNGRALYRTCLEKLEDVQVGASVISWPELDQRLGRLAAHGRPMFDVTTLKKNLLMDVVALLLSRDCSDVFNFELLKAPNYDERDLIHALRPNEYKYRSIAESRHIEAARRRMVSRSMTFRSIAWLTLAITGIVAAVQIFFPNGWGQAAVTVIATATSIAAWLYFFRRENIS
ncbi:hypothetical protein amrb99_73760 [Actinomadura sp. RB99]|uniref:hypothetical protein n=1 Tax=Actinomadura sp. RB99 TaxID=2691577 RepID=UPI0016834B9C|nr:hypothetical protein [Actinomadura sp. RB99]MBD2898406.1 hypothetical protein [Actinomadura sp. RB99]